MRFASPEWLFLILIWGVAAWYWKGLRGRKPLRWICVILVSLWLSSPEINTRGSGMDLWVLVDRSESAKDALTPRLTEWETLVEKSKRSQDRVRWIDFAAESVIRSSGHGGAHSGQAANNSSETRLRTAILHALNQSKSDRTTKILLLSDGYSTESLDRLSERLRAQKVMLDLRLASRSRLGDVQISHLSIPKRVQKGAPFIIDGIVEGDGDSTLSVQILRDGVEFSRRDLTLKEGRARIRLVDLVNQAGAYQYEMRIFPENDPNPGNNVAKQWVEVEGGQKVLLISNYEDDPLVPLITSLGLEVVLIHDPSTLTLGSLTGTKAVILNNIPAHLLPNEWIQGLDFYVHHQGGGLMMIGGKYSFGSGGYHASPIDPLLPVSMELKEDVQKATLAMSIILDRSGSMSVTLPNSLLDKMSMANQGAVNALMLLGNQDLLSVYAVDSAPHQIINLSLVGNQRSELANVIQRIQSEGGGIYVYQGLKTAWDELKKFTAGQKHLILFADADDAEEPGDYLNLLDEIVRNQGSVSVIGLGNEQSKDVELLREIAAKGNGRFFLNQDPHQIPHLFSQETIAVARSTFIEEPTFLHGQPAWSEMGVGPLNWLPRVDGYNLNYLKPGASVAAISGDEFESPLVSFWQRGLGRVAAIAFPMGGDFSNLTRSWSEYGAFSQTFMRWLMGHAVPSGLGLRTQFEGNRLFVDLYADETWQRTLSRKAPELILAIQTDQYEEKILPISWERMSSEHFRTHWDMPPGGRIRGAVKIDDASFSFGPMNSVYHQEWRFDPNQINAVKRLSELSGGKELADLTDVWRRDQRDNWRQIRNWLLPILMLMILLDAWQTRTGWAGRWLK